MERIGKEALGLWELLAPLCTTRTSSWESALFVVSTGAFPVLRLGALAESMSDRSANQAVDIELTASLLAVLD